LNIGESGGLATKTRFKHTLEKVSSAE